MNRLTVLAAIARIRMSHPGYAVQVALDDLEEDLDLVGAGTDRRVRADDPDSAHEGAFRIEPKVGTRKSQVLARLMSTDGGWVPAERLHTEACGGSEGLRRLRELRADGWNIEVRFPGEGTRTEYRLRPMEQLTLPA